MERENSKWPNPSLGCTTRPRALPPSLIDLVSYELCTGAKFGRNFQQCWLIYRYGCQIFNQIWLISTISRSCFAYRYTLCDDYHEIGCEVARSWLTSEGNRFITDNVWISATNWTLVVLRARYHSMSNRIPACYAYSQTKSCSDCQDWTGRVPGLQSAAWI